MSSETPFVDTEFDRRVDLFELAWQRGEVPDLGDFLPSEEALTTSGTHRHNLLIELVMVDLEYRWRRETDQRTQPEDDAKRGAGTPPGIPFRPRIEDYLAARSELGPRDQLPLVLITSEYRTRQRWGDQPSHQEFLERFAEHRPVLAAALHRVDERLPVSTTEHAGSGELFSQDLRASGLDDLGRRERVGEFRVLREIGRGAMGVVYEAEQLSLGRIVALKVLEGVNLASGRAVKRFRNEARAAATLDHPNIVSLYSVGKDQGVHYYAMQLISGKSVADVIDDLRELKRTGAELDGSSITQAVKIGRSSSPVCDPTTEQTPRVPAKAAGVTSQPVTAAAKAGGSPRDFYRGVAGLGVAAAQALQYAHEHGVIHRDVKPANLLLDEQGVVFIADFGLARMASLPGDTMSGELLGTLRYMAPEHTLGQPVVVDGRCDIYSLAVTLYEVLLQRPAHDGEDRGTLLGQLMFDGPPPLRRIDPAIPRDLETIILKGMEPDADQRYATAGEFAEELQRFVDDQPIRTKPPTLPQRGRRWVRHHRRFALFAAAGVVLLVLAGFVTLAMVTEALWETHQAQAAALTQKQAAETARDDAIYHQYVADIRLAHHEWSLGNLLRVTQVLKLYNSPETPRVNHDWEWHYLRSLCHRDEVTLIGHTDTVHEIAWSPDQQQIASVSSDGTLRIWHPLAERDSMVLPQQGEVHSVAWHPDGTRIALATDHAIRIQNPVTGEELLVLESADALPHIYVLRWSPDGQWLASATGFRLAVWRADTGQLAWEVNTPQDDFATLCWNPAGTKLATGGNYRHATLRIWDVSTGRELGSRMRAHGHRIASIDWSPAGDQLATGSYDQRIKTWNADSLELIHDLHGHNGVVTCVRWHPTRDVVASSGIDGLIKIWDSITGEEQAIVRGHLGQISSVDWNRDGSRLASGGADQLIKVWDPFRSQGVQVVDGGAKSWSPDGGRFAVSYYLSDNPESEPPSSRTIDIYAYGDGIAERIRRFDTAMVDAWVPDCEWSPSGSRLAALVRDSEYGGWILVWDSATGEEVARVRGHSHQPRDLAWSPDGKRFATSDMGGHLKIWSCRRRSIRYESAPVRTPDRLSRVES